MADTKTIRIKRKTWERLMEKRLKMERDERITMDKVITELLDGDVAQKEDKNDV